MGFYVNMQLWIAMYSNNLLWPAKKSFVLLTPRKTLFLILTLGTLHYPFIFLSLSNFHVFVEIWQPYTQCSNGC